MDGLDDNQWLRVDKGNRVQEVHLSHRSARYFVIDSEDRKAYEEAMRQRSMARAQQALDKVAAAVAAYKELATVESGFRDLKEVIDMRPIHHKRDDRICAHVFVATLALFLKRTLEYQLASKLPELSGTDAIVAMRSIGLAELDVGGRTVRLVSHGGRDARRVLSALGITHVDPLGAKKVVQESRKRTM